MPYQYYQPFSFYIIFYSYPVTNSSTLPICFVSNFFLKFSSTSKTTPISSHRIIPSEDILWLSFNSVTISLGSLFFNLDQEVLLPTFFSKHYFDITIFPLSYPLIACLSLQRFITFFIIYNYLKIIYE